MPIFVLTRRPPKRHPRETENLTFTFVTDGIESAIRQAKVAVGEKYVTLIGAPNTAQQCLGTGLANELHIDIMPVLLGDGSRFFEDINEGQIRLERLKMIELPGGRTHLRFRIVR